MGCAGDRKRAPHARYRLTWFDFNWNEMKGGPRDMSAHDAIECIEEWNRNCQREARNDSIVIADETLPIHLSIEVLFV